MNSIDVWKIEEVATCWLASFLAVKVCTVKGVEVVSDSQHAKFGKISQHGGDEVYHN